MLKIMAVARRRPGMTHAEYVDYVINVHGAIARKNPVGLMIYRQSHVYDSAFGSSASNDHVGVFHRDSVTELHFASPADMARTFADEYTQTVVAPDGLNFAEIATNASLLAQESVLVEPIGRSGLTKIMHFLVSVDGNDSAAQAVWADAHETALAAAPSFAAALSGVIRSDVRPSGSESDRHFGGVVAPIAALVATLWLPDDAVPTFRQYETALMASGHFDHQHSFFLLTHEHCVLDRSQDV